jgi:hypothetical protein
MIKLTRPQQFILLGVGLTTLAGLVFFLFRGTILRIKDRRDRIQFGLRRSKTDEIQ